MDTLSNEVASSAEPLTKSGDEDDGPTMRRDPPPPYDPQPLAHRRTTGPPPAPDIEPDDVRGRGPGIVLATLLDASSRTLSGLGLTQPSRLPLGLLGFGVLFFLLGLPEGWIKTPLSPRLFEFGDWNGVLALKAAMIEVLIVFTLSLATSRPRLAAASREVPERVRQRLLERVDALIAEPVADDAHLADWMRRQEAWYQGALAELAESLSPQAADGLRRVPVDDSVHFTHRYNDVHDAALGLLARRAHYLQQLKTLRPD